MLTISKDWLANKVEHLFQVGFGNWISRTVLRAGHQDSINGKNSPAKQDLDDNSRTSENIFQQSFC